MLDIINRCVIKTNESIYCVYVEGSDLWVKEHTSEGVGVATIVCHNINSGFSVTVKEREIYLFCQDTKSNVNLCYFDGGKWTVKPILKSNSDKNINLHFFVSMMESMTMLYNMPDYKEGKMENIIFHSSDKFGKWNAPLTLDSIVPFQGTPFYVQQIKKNPDHCVVFYQRRYANTSYEIGYREIMLSDGKWTEFNSIYKSGYFCTDQSFITTKDSIHSALILRGMFSFQLIYQNKKGDYITPPFVLFESQSITSVILLHIKGSLVVFFISNADMYRCVSEDDGATFSRPQRYKNRSYGEYTKAMLIDVSDNVEVAGHQFFMKRRDISNLEFLIEINKEFMSLKKKTLKKVSDEKKNKEPAAALEAKPENDDRYSTNEEIEFFKNKISQLNFQIEEKDKQLFEMTGYIAKMNETITNSENNLREKSKQIADENNELKSRIRQMDALSGELLKLTHENDELKAEITKLRMRDIKNQDIRNQNENRSNEADDNLKNSFIMNDFIDWDSVSNE